MITSRKVVVLLAAAALFVGAACTMFFGLSRATVTSVRDGILRTNLLPWQANEGVNGFIAEQGWALVDTEPGVSAMRWTPTRPDGITLKIEALQERTSRGEVMFFVTPIGGDEGREVCQSLANSLVYRYGTRSWRL